MEYHTYQMLHSFDLVFQLELLLRIVLSCFFGYVIGYERKSRDKSAGMRTHAIVALGAALMMIISKYGFKDIPNYDASRVAAQIVSGIGFLGAGLIFVKNNTVSGLTTAAGVWTTAGVGMAIGAGAYFIGVAAAVLVVVTQIILHKITFLTAEPVRGHLKVVSKDSVTLMEDLQAQFTADRIKIMNVKVDKSKESVKMEFDLIYPARFEKNGMITSWSKDSRVELIHG